MLHIMQNLFTSITFQCVVHILLQARATAMMPIYTSANTFSMLICTFARVLRTTVTIAQKCAQTFNQRTCDDIPAYDGSRDTKNYTP